VKKLTNEIKEIVGEDKDLAKISIEKLTEIIQKADEVLIESNRKWGCI